MKHTRLVILVAVLFAAGLGMGCDGYSPTAPMDPCMHSNGDPNWRVPPGYSSRPCPPLDAQSEPLPA